MVDTVAGMVGMVDTEDAAKITSKHFSSKTPCKQGVLLINLGTPNSAEPQDVKRYLNEFLLDPRVIDSPYLLRQLLVRGFIIPSRYKESAKNYRAIWTKEGSPLKIYGERVCTLLQQTLGDNYHVELAMRYQNPSIKQALDKVKKYPSLIIIPLFPQYSSATTGSIIEEVFKHLSQEQNIPSVRCINQFYNHPKFINAFCERAQDFDLSQYDHILFSFHGLPQRQLKKANPHCLQKEDCCRSLHKDNYGCYSAQCYETASLIANQLQIKKNNYTVTFQSRLGKEPWIMPYTADTIDQLAKKGSKKLLVFCPAFVADCLETIFEIRKEYAENFVHAGGEKLDLVTSLNDHPLWIETLADLCRK